MALYYFKRIGMKNLLHVSTQNLQAISYNITKTKRYDYIRKRSFYIIKRWKPSRQLRWFQCGYTYDSCSFAYGLTSIFIIFLSLFASPWHSSMLSDNLCKNKGQTGKPLWKHIQDRQTMTQNCSHWEDTVLHASLPGTSLQGANTLCDIWHNFQFV